jgi:DNA-3-methyladenine glycosylase I
MMGRVTTQPAPATARCFGNDDDLLGQYHDAEWGRPVHGEDALYERLVLEGFQVGLSWALILRRREALREAFEGFDSQAVARFTDDDVARLVQDPGLIRNRAKIRAAITNARAMGALHEAGGTLDGLVWAHVPAAHRRPRDWSEVPTDTPESQALAKDLKRAGFTFVGPVTAYAMMQACGLVNDHVLGCPAVDR